MEIVMSQETSAVPVSQICFNNPAFEEMFYRARDVLVAAGWSVPEEPTYVYGDPVVATLDVHGELVHVAFVEYWALVDDTAFRFMPAPHVSYSYSLAEIEGDLVSYGKSFS